MPATATKASRRIRERATSTAHRVDVESGMIYHVRICGESSANGRRYPADTLRRATHLYEGARVFLGHDTKNDGLDRHWDDWAGVLINIRMEGAAMFGDLRLRQESKHFRGIVEAAEKFNSKFGMSHVIDAESHREGRVDIIDSIMEVISCDLVLNPATNNGLFESISPDLGGSLAGGVDGVALDQLFQKLASIIDELETLSEATPENLRALSAVRREMVEGPTDPDATKIPIDNPNGHSIIANQFVLEISGTLTKLLAWWSSLPIRPEAKAAADDLAQIAQDEAQAARAAELEKKIKTAESRLQRFTGERSGEAIFNKFSARLAERREAPSTPMTVGTHRTPDEIFEAAKQRLAARRG